MTEHNQDLTFILISSKNTVRQQGLLDSKARSHAAKEGWKASHRRRKEGCEQHQAVQHSTLKMSNLPSHRTMPAFNVAPVYDPWVMSTGYRVDPFCCIPGSEHPFARTALDFFVDYIYKMQTACNYAFGIVNFWTKHGMPMMAQNAALFHATLALLTFAHQYLYRSNSTGMQEQILHHQDLAIRELRCRLLTEKDPLEDDGSILTMFMLCVSPVSRTVCVRTLIRRPHSRWTKVWVT
jgi:hypothetical protein